MFVKNFIQKFKQSIWLWEPYLCSIFNSIQRCYVKLVNLKLIDHNIFNPYSYLGKNVSYLYMITTEYKNEHLQYFQATSDSLEIVSEPNKTLKLIKDSQDVLRRITSLNGRP